AALAADDKPAAEKGRPHFFTAEAKESEGSVVTNHQQVNYKAIAGTLVVHAKGWDDVSPKADGDEKGEDKAAAEASMFYVAYFKKDARAENRPITFIYNGGPGSATVWLHMGAFGPRRIITNTDQHLPAAPYKVAPNDESLLDASDLVFIDAPGAGFSRIAGPDKEKAFWGIDQDGYAFAEFITGFLNKYGRWQSPKYLFGESYGTTRSAVLVNMLEQRAIDFNGVMLLSQILAFDLSPDSPYFNPAVDIAYETSLPTYAATAYYHKKLPEQPKDLKSFLDEVEKFATTDYALALAKGADLPAAERDAIAEKLHKYTGLSVDYIKKADIRVSGGEFTKNLQDDSGTTTGRIDTRFSGPDIDPLAKEADYDPFIPAIGSAYIAGFNDYARKDLKWGEDRRFKLFANVGAFWDFKHVPPGSDQAPWQSPNVMVDLANAMKTNPKLKVQLNVGYYDLATPFYEGVYEMKHLPIPAKLQANIDYKFYESGHMVYAQDASLKQLHDNAAEFIKSTSGVSQ
ncbi:MAG TPA: peptidase S10, partial [Magnetospirillaceae bacterium]|nr:peptidase S10 [Magnetospirillaceae bacterium]